jgi:hypothetical protein
MEENTEKTDNKLNKPYLFQKGDDPRRNLNGRPKGSLSVIGRLKQMWEENPEDFEEFVKEYKKDPQNRKHITEMIDGKPKQDIKMEGDLTINVISYGNNPTT